MWRNPEAPYAPKKEKKSKDENQQLSSSKRCFGFYLCLLLRLVFILSLDSLAAETRKAPSSFRICVCLFVLKPKRKKTCNAMDRCFWPCISGNKQHKDLSLQLCHKLSTTNNHWGYRFFFSRTGAPI